MQIGLESIWNQFLHIAHDEVGSRVVDTWLKAVALSQWDAAQKIVYLQAPNVFVRDWIQKHYTQLFKVHLGRLLHVDSLSVIIQTDDIKKEIKKRF